MKAEIAGISVLSPTIRKFTLRAGSGKLPMAAPGAHILLEIPGPARTWKNAYSLVSADGVYEIIVRRVEKSRGGSAWLHDHAAIGDRLEMSLPQNLFPLARNARKHLLLSAGIGITPFLSYLKYASLAAFELHHLCKPEDAGVFESLLADVQLRRRTIHTSRNALDLPALLAAQKLDTHLYLCGPESFMDNALAAAGKLGWPASKIHLEMFGGATGGSPFVAHLARSKTTIQVGPEETLLEALEAAGLNPPCLCRGGACGECELPVLAGIPDHHDHFLSAEKRAANRSMMTCVSRARTPELTLDF